MISDSAGVKGRPALHEIVQCTVEQARKPDSAHFPRIQKLAAEVVSRRQCRVRSLEELADRVGIDRRGLPQALQLLAASVVETERMHRANIEKVIVDTFGKENLLM